jgi:hypothetical protein
MIRVGSIRRWSKQGFLDRWRANNAAARRYGALASEYVGLGRNIPVAVMATKANAPTIAATMTMRFIGMASLSPKHNARGVG